MAKKKTNLRSVDEQFEFMSPIFGGPKHATNQKGEPIRFELKKIDMGRDFDNSRCVGVMTYFQTHGKPFEKKPKEGWPIRRHTVIKFWGDDKDMYNDNLYCVVDDWQNRKSYWSDSYLKVVEDILKTFDMKPIKDPEYAPGSFAQDPSKLD